MDLPTALYNIEALANGIDPNTGEMFDKDSVYNRPDIIRSLYTLLTLVKRSGKIKKTKEQKQQENLSRGLPKNAGITWTSEERHELWEKFKAGAQLTELAQYHERSQGSIIAELKKQGLIQD